MVVLLTFSLNFLVFVFVPLDDDVVEDVVDFGERDRADAN